MTESTKTPAVKKTAPAKKAAAAPKKAVTKVTPVRTDYKPGARVKISTSGGASKEYKGYVDRVEVKATGAFVYVNVGDKKNPVIKGFRAKRVRGF